MGFWIFMLCMDLLIPVMMILFGWIFMKKPPKNINGFYGYRTPRSTRNQDTWDFAHKYHGKIWFTWGVILLPVSIMAMLLVYGKEIDTIGNWGGILCYIQLVPMVGSILLTERALKQRFDNYGNKR